MGNLMRAEWTKLRSVRSTMWSLGITVVLSIGITTLATAMFTSNWATLSPENRTAMQVDSIGLMLQPAVMFAQIVIAVFAVLVVTSEFSTRTITATMLAAPRRRSVIAAKLAVLLCVVIAVAEVIAFVSFFVGQAIVSRHVDVSLMDPGVLRAVLSYGLYLGIVAMLAFGVGLSLRHSAGAITTTIVGIIVLPILPSFIPGETGERLAAFMPASNASQGVLSTNPDISPLVSSSVALAAFGCWAVVAVTAGMFLTVRRDV
jgi:ABC-2 type transport system permease protein